MLPSVTLNAGASARQERGTVGPARGSLEPPTVWSSIIRRKTGHLQRNHVGG